MTVKARQWRSSVALFCVARQKVDTRRADTTMTMRRRGCYGRSRCAQVFKPSQQSIIAQGEATIRRALVIKQMLSRHGSRESPEVRYGDFLFHVGRWDARPTMYWRLHSAPQVSQGRALSHCARCWLRVSHDAVWGCAKPRPTQSTCARGHMLQQGRNRSPGKWV